MLKFLLKIFIFGLISWFSIWGQEKLKNNWFYKEKKGRKINPKKYERIKKYLLYFPILIVFFTYIGNESINFIEKKFNEPEITFAADETTDTIVFKLKIEKGKIEKFTIDYPVKGGITELENSHSLSDINITKAIARGLEGDPFNHFEMIAEDLSGSLIYSFSIKYEANKGPVDFGFTGIDKYQITYNWIYNGDSIIVSQWREKGSNKITTKPPGRVSAIRIINDPKEYYLKEDKSLGTIRYLN